MDDIENQTQDGQQPNENPNPSTGSENTESLLNTKVTQTPEGQKPEYLPVDCWDAETNQVKSDELLKAYEQEAIRVKGLRTKLAKGGDKAPATAKDYQFTFDEGVEIKDGDTALDVFKDVAHELKLSNDDANKLLNEFIKRTGGFNMDTEPSPEQIETQKAAEIEKIGGNAMQVLRAVNSWGKEMIAQGVWSEDDMHAIESVATTADVVVALNKLRTVMGGSDIPTVDGIDDGLPSDKEIFQIIQSKQYQEGDVSTLKKVDNYLSLRTKAGRPQYLQV